MQRPPSLPGAVLIKAFTVKEAREGDWRSDVVGAGFLQETLSIWLLHLVRGIVDGVLRILI